MSTVFAGFPSQTFTCRLKEGEYLFRIRWRLEFSLAGIQVEFDGGGVGWDGQIERHAVLCHVCDVGGVGRFVDQFCDHHIQPYGILEVRQLLHMGYVDARIVKWPELTPAEFR